MENVEFGEAVESFASISMLCRNSIDTDVSHGGGEGPFETAGAAG